MSLKVESSPGFFLMLALLLYLDGGLIFWAALSAALLHELAHCTAAQAFGAKIRCLRLTAAGAEMELYQQRPLSYPAEFIIALSGPLANLVLAFALANLPVPNRFLLAGVHLSLGTFNLLPVEPLDGSQLLRIILSVVRNPQWGQRSTKALSLSLSVAVTALGLMLLRRSANPSLLVTGLWLLSRNLPKRQKNPRSHQ